jgi:hypothetical protein
VIITVFVDVNITLGAEIRLFRDGTEVVMYNAPYAAQTSGFLMALPISRTFVDYPGAGLHSYQVGANKLPEGSFNGTYRTVTITAMGAKR